MAVDLSDLVESLKREVNPPGVSLYPNAASSVYLGNLRDAFWEAKLFGMMDDWIENPAAYGGDTSFGEGIVTPTGALVGYDGGLDGEGNVQFAIDDDMPRERQQLIVLYAGYRIVLTAMQNLKSAARYKAGPVEYETQQAASVIKGVLDAIRERIHLALDAISTNTGNTSVTAFDAVIERTYTTALGDAWWVR